MNSQDMRNSRYTDGPPDSVITTQPVGSLPPPPTGVMFPTTRYEFESYATRIWTPFVVYVATSITPEQKYELSELAHETAVPVIGIDVDLMPDLFYAFGRNPPLFIKMYKHRVMRYLDVEPTMPSVKQFTISDRQWRSKGFYE